MKNKAHDENVVARESRELLIVGSRRAGKEHALPGNDVGICHHAVFGVRVVGG